jgi:hypothetical protein
MALHIKDKLLKFVGYALLFMGIMLMVVGIAMHLEKDSKHSDQGSSIAMGSTAFSIPGAIMIFLGIKARKEFDMTAAITSLVKSYRRITLLDIAQKLGINVSDAGKLLTRALSEGMVRGNFDRTTDEFFTDEAKSQTLDYKFCPGCGAPLEKVILEGETARCDSCGKMIR